MSSDKTNLKSDNDTRASMSGDSIAENNQHAKLEEESLKQDKFKQDQLRLEKLRQETLRQEKLRQEFENQDLERQKAHEQEKLKQQQLQQEKLELKKFKIEEEQRLRVEKEYKEQLRLESERVKQEKIDTERVRQDQLMRARLEKERVEKEELRRVKLEQEALEAKTLKEKQSESAKSKTQEPSPKKAILGFADKLRSTLKSVEEKVAVSKVPEKSPNVEKQTEKKIETKQQAVIRQPVINARTIQLCGNLEEHVYAEDSDEIRYDPEDYVLSSILHHLDQTKRSMDVIRLKFDATKFVIDYSLNTIFCNISPTSPEFDKLCATPSTQAFDVYQLGYDEVRVERRNSVKLGNAIDAFVWTSTLLTAKGRLPVHTDLSRTIGIKQGADFSKLEVIPYMDEIIAALHEKPCLLMELASRLNIPLKYVFSFYSAAFNVNFLEFDVKKKKVSPIIPKKSLSGFFRK